MRKRKIGVLAVSGALLLGGCAAAAPPFKGNDTGGIIAWSPDVHPVRHEIAADHCARFGKVHRITSVTPRYGDYIGFECYWPRGVDPHRIVVRRAN